MMNNGGSPCGTKLLLVGDGACTHPAKTGRQKMPTPTNAIKHTSKGRQLVNFWTNLIKSG